MCCGRKRDAIPGGTVDTTELKLYYLGDAPIRIRGSVTGQSYTFSRLSPLQTADRRDAVLMLQTRLFRPTK